MDEQRRQEPIRIAHADRDELSRLGMRALLTPEDGLQVVCDVGSGTELLDHARDQRLDLAIVDLALPDATGGHVARELARLRPHCRILGLAMTEEPARIAELMRGGATGFASKTQSGAEILDAVRCTAAGTEYLPPSIDAARVHELLTSPASSPFEQLTAREREVFDLLVRGLGNHEIAARLLIARRTVETHRQHLMRKLGARTPVDLVHLALRHGVGV
jgi:DNA-binding NarL/FixJ family response regulator